jgi:hypothetical protein
VFVQLGNTTQEVQLDKIRQKKLLMLMPNYVGQLGQQNVIADFIHYLTTPSSLELCPDLKDLSRATFNQAEKFGLLSELAAQTPEFICAFVWRQRHQAQYYRTSPWVVNAEQLDQLENSANIHKIKSQLPPLIQKIAHLLLATTYHLEG